MSVVTRKTVRRIEGRVELEPEEVLEALEYWINDQIEPIPLSAKVEVDLTEQANGDFRAVVSWTHEEPIV